MHERRLLPGAGVLLAAAVLVLGAAPGGPPPARADGEAANDEARGLELFRKRDYKAARPLLEKACAAPGASDDAQMSMALLAFYYAEDELAETHLKKLSGEVPLAHALRVCLEGPFKKKLGDAVHLSMGRTTHYALATDIGCDDALVKATQAEWDKMKESPKKYAARIEKLKTKRSKGFDEVGSHLERIYAEYSSMFKVDRDEKLISRVIVFGVHEEFKAFSNHVSPGLGEGAQGFYWPPLRILFINADTYGDLKSGLVRSHGVEVIYHEAFHQFLDYYIDHAPPWFNEGIAEYFAPSETVPGQKRLRVGVIDKKSAGLVANCLKPNPPFTLTPLRILVKQTQDDMYDRQKQGLNYSTAWLFIHYLANKHPKGAKMIVTYFNALRTGKGWDAAHEEAFKDVDWDKMEAEWKAYVLSLPVS